MHYKHVHKLASVGLLFLLCITIFGGTFSSVSAQSSDEKFSPPFDSLITKDIGTICGSADFNGDGNIDLVTKDTTSFQILLGDGNGKFSFKAEYEKSIPPTTSVWYPWETKVLRNVLVGKFDADDIPDIIVFYTAYATYDEYYGVLLYSGVGDGTFVRSQTILEVLPGVTSPNRYMLLFMGHLNSDETWDLFILYNKHVGWDSSVFGYKAFSGDNLTGNFDPLATGELSVGELNNPWYPSDYNCKFGDLNRDGVDDLVFLREKPTYDYSKIVETFLGDGHGNFQDTSMLELSVDQAGLHDIFDINLDGNNDVVVNLYDEATGLTRPVFFSGNGDGTFSSEQNIFDSTQKYVVSCLGDLNSDSLLDFVEYSSPLRVYTAKEDGSFELYYSFNREPSDYSGFWAIDVNNDGNLDLVNTYAGGTSGIRVRFNTLPPRLINLGIVPIELSDMPIGYSKEYYETVCTQIEEYFLEVSYNKLIVNSEVLTKDDGGWFSVPFSSSHFLKDGRACFFKNATESCKNEVEFTRYDYDAVNGTGVLVFVTRQHVWNDSSFFNFATSSTGFLNVADGVYVDVIYTFEDRFRSGVDPVIRGLAHEFGHFLGKTLVTSVDDESKDGWWALPDLYTRKNYNTKKSVDSLWALMGDLNGRYDLEKVHMCSYSKEWLGWLSYKEAPKHQLVEITALSDLDYNDEIYRYTYSTFWEFLAPNYFIFELRTNSSSSSTWDTETPYNHALTIYQVDERVDFPKIKYDSVNLISILKDGPNQFVDVDLGLNIILHSISEDNAVISIQDYKTSKLKGASMKASAKVFSEAFPQYASEFDYDISMPDLDLHAYASDGGHVGVNYETGLYEMGISGAIASGDLLNGREWIYVPEDVDVKFLVSTTDTVDFFSSFPESAELTDSVDTFSVSVGYYDENEARYNSSPLIQNISMGDMFCFTPNITRNLDETYNVTLSTETNDESYYLTLAVSGSGNTNPSIGVHTCEKDSTVDVTASASTGWAFNNWILDGVNVGTTNPYTVSMDANHSLTAVFAEIPAVNLFDLTITVSGSGSTSPSVGVHSYTENTDVPVAATPATGWTFDHWELDSTNVGNANSYTVTMNADHTLNAVFNEISISEPAVVLSCNTAGTETNLFFLGDIICAKGEGFVSLSQVDVYIVEDVLEWTDNMDINTLTVMATNTGVSIDESGKLHSTSIWTSNLVPGKYDLVVDSNLNGVYDQGVDAVDYNGLEIKPVQNIIPEYSLGTITGLTLMILALVGMYVKNKRH